MPVSPDKHDEFVKLYQEFAATYPQGDKGRSHSALYESSREQGRKNFQEIRRRGEAGVAPAALTKDVMGKLLPHTDSEKNRQNGNWIHVSPFAHDAWKMYQSKVKAEDWPHVVQNLLTFLTQCEDEPGRIAEACATFSDSPHSKGFQAGTLSPILNALHPDDFLVVNFKTYTVIDYFSDKHHERKLRHYPEALQTEKELIAEFGDTLRAQAFGLPEADAFDMFFHWLVSIKKHLPKPPPPPSGRSIWKIAPGDKAKWWDQCLEGGYICVGWNELGDISGLSQEEFHGRMKEAQKQFPDWGRQGMQQVFTFANEIKQGDIVLANNGTSRVVGIGAITGDYYYVDEKEFGYCHRRAVEWQEADIEVRKPGWLRTLMRINQQEYDAIVKPPPPPPPSPPGHYTFEDLQRETHLPEDVLRRWLDSLHRKGQAILYGPPGTGKTYVAERIARHLTSGSDGFVELLQLHPSYAYEDFIQGIRPNTSDGALRYDLEPGRFLEFCEKARSRSGICVLILDEINRANLSRVFGELMYLLEYRDQDIPLAGGRRLSIPRNVRIIGTMNTADRSIALVDHALRRRFAFFPLQPSFEILHHFHAGKEFDATGLAEVLLSINQVIKDPHYEVGISFFLRSTLQDDLQDIWQMEIEPYLEEYFFDKPEQVNKFRWEKIKGQVLPERT